MNEPTALQQIIDEEQVDDIIEDLEAKLDEDHPVPSFGAWKLAFTVTPQDIPHIIEELEEVTDGG